MAILGVESVIFGVGDLDMEKRGWKNTSMNALDGISRHRISSALYYYIDNPNGGEAEHHADTDYLDHNWVPRAWDFKFGSLLWSANTPPMFRGHDIPWDMQFDADDRSFKPYRKGKVSPNAARLAALTSEDEHAI